MSDYSVTVVDESIAVTVDVEADTTATIITIAEQGPEGIPGPQGDQGDPGPSDHTLLSNIGTKSHEELELDLLTLASEISDRIPYAGAAADINLGNAFKVINMADPSAAQDAATKKYVDDSFSITEPPIAAGTVDQYWRGDKTWQSVLDITEDYIPYSGGTADVDLNGFNFTAYNIFSQELFSNSSVNLFDINTSAYAKLSYSGGSFQLSNADASPSSLDLYGIGAIYGSFDDLNVASIFVNSSFQLFDLVNTSYGYISLSDSNYTFLDTSSNPAYLICAGLKDSGGVESINVVSRVAGTSTGFSVIDWENTQLKDNVDGYTSVSWSQRLLTDNVINPSYDWQNRRFAADSGQYFIDHAAVQEFKVIGRMMLGSSFASPVAKLHLDSGNAQASALKFTAGTTTGQTTSDGFDIGITTSGVAEIRQREALALLFYTNNTNFMSLAATSPTLTLDSQGSNSANAGTIIFRTVGGSESFTQAFDANANVFTWSYGATAAMRIDSAAKLSIYQGTTLRGAVATVYSQINSVGNIGVGEDNLHSFSVPSSGFAANGDSFEVKCSGTFAANANNKRVKLKFGAITLFDTTALAFNTGDWEISARIFRTSTTTGKSVVTWTCNNVILTTTTDYQSWAFNFLTANTLVVTGEATANNDIVQELMQVFWIPVS